LHEKQYTKSADYSTFFKIYLIQIDDYFLKVAISGIQESMNPDSSAEDIPLSIQTDIPGTELGPALAKVSISLLILIGLMIATVWLLKRIIHGKTRAANANQLIQIVEKRALSPKTMLYIVSVDGQKHVIAESQLEVRTLFKATEIYPK
jgi:hypothetical protein